MAVGELSRIGETIDSERNMLGSRCDYRSIINILKERSAQGEQPPVLSFLPDKESATHVPWSWRELDIRAQDVARVLADQGRVGRGDRVLLVYSGGLDFIAALFACFYLGAIPIPVSPPRRRERLSRWGHIFEDSQAVGILTSAHLQQQLEPVAKQNGGLFCISPKGADPAHPTPSDSGLEPEDIGPEDVAFLQYTSGSTDAPKGVVITHGNIMANMEQIASVFQITPQDRMVSWLPHYHDMGLIGTVFSPLYSGFSITFMTPAAFLRSPMRFLELASQIRATGFGSPNFGFDHCVRHATPETLANLDLSSLRVAFSGSEMIRPDTMETFRSTFAPAGLKPQALMSCYGMAEAVLLIAGNNPGAEPRFDTVDRTALNDGDARCAPTGLRLASCGTVAPGMEIAIVEPKTGQALSDGKVGEIWVRGANVASGYWRNPEATAWSFNQILNGREDWFRTGDLGFLNDAELFVTGRLKEVIIIRGQNHAPQDIEATVAAAHDALADTRIAAFADEGEGQDHLAVVVELRRDVYRHADAISDAAFAAIRSAVSQVHGVQIGHIALIRPGSILVTPSGKVQRFACRDGLRDGSLPILADWRHKAERGAETSGWRSALDAAQPLRRYSLLVAEMQAVLTRLAGLPADQSVSERTRLFDLGFDSVAGVEFVSTLERELGLTLDPVLIYEFPTLGALAPWLLGRLYPTYTADPAPVSDLAEEIAALEALLKA